MGIREYDHEYLIEDPGELQRIKGKREKDERELNDLCKNICLCVGWSLVLILIIYIFFIIICDQ